MTQKNSIDVIIIAKNEQDRIEDCISRVSWADHVIVVDNHSSDKTSILAKNRGAIILESRSTDFAELRMVGAGKAQSDWILYLDADELVTDELQKEILSIVTKGSEHAAYILQRKNYYLGHLWPYMDGMVRFIKRSALISWIGKLHESANIKGSVDKLHGFVIHDTHRTLQEMVEKTNLWSATEAKLRFEGNHPAITWWRLLRVMITGFWRSYVTQGGWKAGTVGWIESMYQAFSMFITYSKLWELQQEK